MVAGDTFLLTTTQVHGSIPGGPDNMVFAYTQSAGSGNSADLMLGFDTDIQPLINAVVSNLCAVSLYEVINLDDFDDYTSAAPTDGAGDVSGDVMPPWVTYSIRYVRTTREIRDGRKALGLVPESCWASNTLAGAAATNMPVLVAALLDPIVYSSNTFVPQIWRRPGTYKPHGVPTVYPSTMYPVGDVLFAGLGSQNTRKR